MLYSRIGVFGTINDNTLKISESFFLILFAIASAINGGTAFPICLNCCVFCRHTINFNFI
jgi:hypothetical protein